MTNFRNLFLAKSARDMNDDHVWFSVVGRPARSPFTRVQRLSCCLTLLYCTMFTNIMFFGRGDDFDPPAPIRFAGLKINPPISWTEVMISIQSAAIILPVNLLIVFLFRRSYSTTKPEGNDEETNTTGKRPNREDKTVSFTSSSDDPDVPTVWSYVVQARRYPQFSSGPLVRSEAPTGTVESNFSNSETSKLENKTKFSLPWCTIYIAWLLLWAAGFAAAYFTVLYTLSFGRAKAEAWIVTFLTTFVTDIFLTQPFKLLTVAVMFALLARTPVEDDDPPPASLQKDEEYLQVTFVSQYQKHLADL
ncbi:polycystin-1-like protein 2 [Branchiostoma lanceolatum]|uniref:polycystin-1-like protein 2 n=1 Tax=Branchiostoma lanceolatum TaxID=7740 RepID=UPI0034525F39